MNNCQTYQELMGEYLDGTITPAQLDQLKEHTRECEACGAEFRRCILMQEILEHAYACETSGDQARTRLLARLAAPHRARVERFSLSWATMALAAIILLTTGLLAGLAMGRADWFRPADVSRSPLTAVSVAELRGTVLVRHKGADVWQALTVGSDIYLGDTFHSAAKSGFVLKMDGESRIEVAQNSMLGLTSYNGETQFSLDQGKCSFNLPSPHGPFFVRTPHGRMEALGTEFTVTVE